MPIRENERSAVIELISEINIYISQYDLLIKRAGGELTLTGNTTALFPDIILFADTIRNSVLQGWEAKMPDISITDATLISNAKQKAILLGVNSFVLWNFKSARLYVCNEHNDFVIVRSWDNPNIQSRTDVDTYEVEWKNTLHEIIIVLNTFFTNNELNTSSIETILSDNLAITLLQRNKILTADFIRNKSIEDTTISNWLNNWWQSYQTDYNKDETDPFNAYAKTLILHWFNRITFANLIKRFFVPAREVENIDTSITAVQANTIFERITTACDFYNIFAKAHFDECIPDGTWSDICAVNKFLIENNIGELSQESIQQILEHTVNINKREICGQYTTPEVLADILVKLTIRNLRDNFFDPCCGSGTIVKAARNYKRTVLSTRESIESVWAEDKDSYPIQIAQLALSEVDGFTIPSRLFKMDVLQLQPDTIIDITNPVDGSILSFNIPKFGAIASNLPFIAFEHIDDFDLDKIREINEELALNGFTVDGRSDIYIPIIFALHKHLKDNGRLGVILSNSWLSTKAGQAFFKALLYYYKVEQIHISGKGKWFKNADVVTTILLLCKKEIPAAPAADDIISFALWKKSIDELSDAELRRQLVYSSQQNQSLYPDVIQIKNYTVETVNQLSTYNLSKNVLFHGIDWFLDISNKLCKKQTIFKVFRGERRGWDNMFYPKANYDIDREFIKPVLLTGKSLNTLIAVPDGEAFCCSLTVTELEQAGFIATLNWINQFRFSVNNVGKPLPQVLSRSNMQWYEMSNSLTADLVTGMNPEKRLFYASFVEPTFINQRLIGLKFIDNTVNKELCHALLNSMLEMFITEATGFGRGLGVLDINAKNIQQSYMLNPLLLNDDQISAIIEAFEPIKNRVINDTEQELQMEDRIRFDHIVLQSYGIDDKYNHIRNALLSLQKTRLSVKDN